MRCTYHTHRKTQPPIRTRRTTRLYTIYPCLQSVLIRTRNVQWSPLYHTYLHGTFVRSLRRYDLNIVTFLSIFVFIRTWYVRWYATSHAYLDGIFVHCACMYLPNHTTLVRTHVTLRHNIRPCECTVHHYLIPYYYPSYQSNCTLHTNVVHFLNPLVHTNVVHL